MDQPRTEPLDREKRAGPVAPVGTPTSPEPGDASPPARGAKDELQLERPFDPLRRRRRTPLDERERWGELPQHARDVFLAEGGDDLPPRYRDWIDAYYHRMNRSR
ncbi:MAG: hypothetical protein HZA52_04500 [Planctomycetes bacterium]|nr:hypothetical protein [Planctomycetota bacterium]